MEHMPEDNISVVLSSPMAYSETFLQAHIQRLAATVVYLPEFPVEIAEAFPKETSGSSTDALKRALRISWHRGFANPLKQILLRRFFRAHRTAVVLAEYGPTGAGALKLCKQLKIPLVVHFHGYDAYSNEVLDAYRESYRKMFRYAAAIIGVSKHMMEQLRGLGAPPDKLFCNPYGVDVTKFEQATIAAAPPRVIAVGRFVEKKAPYLTILAFKKVLKKIPEARLVMVGTGPLHDVCRQMTKAFHIEHAVELGGVADHDRVAALMQQSRVFVQHSLVPASADAEGVPNTILEAGASGLPVVSTRHGGIVDVVVPGKTGFLVEEGDVDAMADCIHDLLTNPSLCREMGHEARRHIAQHHNIERSIRNLKLILEAASRHQSEESLPTQSAAAEPRVN